MQKQKLKKEKSDSKKIQNYYKDKKPKKFEKDEKNIVTNMKVLLSLQTILM